VGPVHVDTLPDIFTRTHTHTHTQTLRAERAVAANGRATVSISNQQHEKCGVQNFECVSGPCMQLTQEDVDKRLPVEEVRADTQEAKQETSPGT
jgi:hypothetical protein